MTQTPQQEHESTERVDTENLRDYRQLRRSVTDRKVAGVAGGLGRHLNIDPTVVRVTLVVLCFFGGAGFVVYAAAWLFFPEDGAAEAPIATSPSARNALLIGAVVLAGLLLVGDSFGGFGFPWPLIPIGAAGLLYLVFHDQRSPHTPVTRPADQPSPAEPEPGPRLFGFTLALLALALGGLGLYDVSGGSVVASAYPALALATVGVMLVVGAWFGRPGGLVLAGVVSAVALAVTSVSGATFAGDHNIDVAPVAAASVRDSYFVPTGTVRLDLSQVRDAGSLAGRTITVRARAGEIVVILPDDVAARVLADVGAAGSISVPGQSQDGTRLHVDRDVDTGGTAGTHTGPSTGTVYLDLGLFLGTIEVRRS